MQTPDIVYLLPLLFVGAGAISLMILSTFKTINMKSATIVSLVFLSSALISNLYILNSANGVHSMYPFKDVFHKMLVVDTYSGYFSSILLVGAILTLLIGLHYFQRHKEFTTEFYSLHLFSVFGMMLLVHANELVSAFISLEITSLSLYVMIGFEKVIDKRIEASYRYLVLGSLAGVLFLLGTAFIYAGTQTTTLGTIGDLALNTVESNTSLITIGATMILITFFFKIAAFPFSNWSLDVYDGAPLPVTAYMAATFKAAIFGFVLRLYLVDFDMFHKVWHDLFIVIIILTLAYGSFLAIVQKSLKRMLVSSSVVHTGYLLIGFVSISAIGESAASSIIYYLVAYFLSSIGAFGLIAYISAEDRLKITYDDFRGFAHIRPYMAAMLSVFMLSLAGIPSTIGFIGKFYIFTGAIESGNSILAIGAIIATFISVYYYFKLIAVMYFYRSSELTDVPPLKGVAPLVIAGIAIAIIWGGIGNTFIAWFPGVDFLINMANSSYDSLFIAQ